MIELENEHRQLNYFLFWNEHEDIFWKWMVNKNKQTIFFYQIKINF
jgi:hypothetical protein